MRRPRFTTRTLIPGIVAVAIVTSAFAAPALAKHGTAKKPAAKIKTTKVTLKMTEFKYIPNKITVKPGKIVFVLKNIGDESHNLFIKTKLSPLVTTGKTKTWSITITKKGTYHFLCAVGEHAARGMVGTLIVK